jgi:hypothetical protein
MQNIIDTLVEVKLLHDDNFLKIKETLTRIGIASPKEKRLYQSCHILHKRGKYYIVHFKELFALDGKMSNFSDDDKSRRDKIAKLLQDWELLEIVNKDNMDEELISINQIKIISHKEKNEWDLVAKYNIGKKKTP